MSEQERWAMVDASEFDNRLRESVTNDWPTFARPFFPEHAVSTKTPVASTTNLLSDTLGGATSGSGQELDFFPAFEGAERPTNKSVPDITMPTEGRWRDFDAHVRSYRYFTDSDSVPLSCILVEHGAPVIREFQASCGRSDCEWFKIWEDYWHGESPEQQDAEEKYNQLMRDQAISLVSRCASLNVDRSSDPATRVPLNIAWGGFLGHEHPAESTKSSGVDTPK
ncbi:uncharacterized protein I206_100503 [Kwoniella pini CBS 10737]|uniref:Uncharacterized protein n=1 Tax=Kwoniella pini CBS 10737 TaxID=1296096 RepID=A0A1B9IE31_9TREE|nr:uncharacterized protein I206_00825 [Kwoniella pini CBS 10737]OCF53520.1 hypothetical protein I206_00825 [Kwoniella pini CBS 10737]